MKRYSKKCWATRSRIAPWNCARPCVAFWHKELVRPAGLWQKRHRQSTLCRWINIGVTACQIQSRWKVFVLWKHWSCGHTGHIVTFLITLLTKKLLQYIITKKKLVYEINPTEKRTRDHFQAPIVQTAGPPRSLNKLIYLYPSQGANVIYIFSVNARSSH